MIPHMLVCGSDQRCPRDVWDHALHKFTRKDPSQHGSIIDELLKGALGEQAQAKLKGAPAEPKACRPEEAMPEGFCRATRGNLQAFRVAFDGFAHLATIELVVDAVTATQDYSVFGSKPLEILLTFKWSRYHRRAFLRGLVSYATYLLLATLYNIEASRTVHHSVSELTSNLGEHAYLFFGWGLTTLVSVATLFGQLRQMYRTYARGQRRTLDYKHLLALFNHVLQLLINVLFWTRDLVPRIMAAPSSPDHAWLGGLRGLSEGGEGGEGSGLGEGGGLWEGGEGGESGFGLFLTLQSWAVVLHFARMVLVLPNPNPA